LGEPWAVCFQYAAWRQFLLAQASVPIRLDSPERPIACPPSWLGHSRFWCYSDRCSACKGKAEHFYSALHGIQTTLKRSGMDHTVLPAINTMPAVWPDAICYLTDHPYSLRSQPLLFLSIMACHRLMRTQANSLRGVREFNIIACPLA